MKLVTLLAVIQAGCVLAAGIPRSPVQECGRLGVMEVPEGEDPSTYRRCLEHPTMLKADAFLAGDGPALRNLDQSPNKPGELMTRQETDKDPNCWFGKTVGCSKNGWCYRSCCTTKGPWCWTAHGGDGRDDWRSCRKDSDCSYNHACGQSLPEKPRCASCGCACLSS